MRIFEYIKKSAIPVLFGGILGYMYYYFIGCNSGSCPITGNPYSSTIYGVLIGLVFAIPSKKKSETEKDR